MVSIKTLDVLMEVRSLVASETQPKIPHAAHKSWRDQGREVPCTLLLFVQVLFSTPSKCRNKHLESPLNPLTTLNLPPPLPLLLSNLLQILHIPTISLPPLRINIPNTKIRAAIRLLVTKTVLNRETQSQELPRILPEPLDFEVFVARNANEFHVVQRGAREDCVDAAGFVVFVPAAAGVFPDGVFDPFLGVGGIVSQIIRGGRLL